MKKRFLSLALVFLLLCGTVGHLLSFQVAAETAPSTKRKQKVIAVVYDNSGSMSTGDRVSYAKYAAQSLIALVDPGDTLYMVPIDPSVCSDNHYKIDLKVKRSEILDSADLRAVFRAAGTTPAVSVGTGVEMLVKEGMQKSEDVVSAEGDDKEYWLVVLTDGLFQDTHYKQVSAEKLLEQYAYGYSGLRTVYLGFGEEAEDLSNSALQSKMPFTALKITEPLEVIEAMQQIACLLSGRLALDSQYVSASGTSVSVDLCGCAYPIAGISVIAQDCNAVMTSASYDGNVVLMEQGCTITPDASMKMQSAYSVVLKNGTTDVPFDKGTVTLQYNNTVPAANVTVLVEPALELIPVVEYKQEANWIEVDSQYINEYLKPGDTVRVNYRALDRYNDTEVDLKQLFGELKENVTYAGTSFATNEELSLVEGRNEIVVSVELVDTTYKLYGSVFCNVEPNPTNFRIEKKVTPAPNGEKTKTVIDYTVYLDGSPASPQTLRNNHFDWDVVVTDNRGTTLPIRCENDNSHIFVSVDTNGLEADYFTVVFTVKSDVSVSARDARMRTNVTQVSSPKLTVQSQVTDTGEDDSWHKRVTYSLTEGTQLLTEEELAGYQWTVRVVGEDGTECPLTCKSENGHPVAEFDLTSMKNGNYTVTFTVQSAHGPVQDVQKVKRSPASMTLKLDKNECAHVTEYDFLDNRRAIVFSLTDGKSPVTIDDTLRYSVTVNGVDVTKYVVISGNQITYVPNPDHFAAGRTIREGTFTVAANVSYKADATVADSATADIIVAPSVFTIEALQGTNHDINRFKITDSNAALQFMILRDGTPLSFDELQYLSENQEIQINNAILGGTMFWFLSERIENVDNNNGCGVLTLKYQNRLPKLLKPIQGLLAMFIWNGERQVTVSYGGAAATDSLNVLPSAVWEYVWRALLTYLFIYLIHWIVGLFTCKAFKRGVIVVINVDDAEASAKITNVNSTFKDKWLWHWKRLIPWPFFKHMFVNQPEIQKKKMVLKIDPKTKREMVMFTGSGFYVLPDRREPSSQPFTAFIDSLKKYMKKGGVKPKFTMDGSAFRRMYGRKKEAEIIKNQVYRITNGVMYAINMPGTEDIDRVIFYYESK